MRDIAQLLRRDVTWLQPLIVVVGAYIAGIVMASTIGVGGRYGTTMYLVAFALLMWCGMTASRWGVRGVTQLRRQAPSFGGK